MTKNFGYFFMQIFFVLNFFEMPIAESQELASVTFILGFVTIPPVLSYENVNSFSAIYDADGNSKFFKCEGCLTRFSSFSKNLTPTLVDVDEGEATSTNIFAPAF